MDNGGKMKPDIKIYQKIPKQPLELALEGMLKKYTSGKRINEEDEYVRVWRIKDLYFGEQLVFNEQSSETLENLKELIVLNKSMINRKKIDKAINQLFCELGKPNEFYKSDLTIMYEDFRTHQLVNIDPDNKNRYRKQYGNGSTEFSPEPITYYFKAGCNYLQGMYSLWEKPGSTEFYDDTVRMSSLFPRYKGLLDDKHTKKVASDLWGNFIVPKITIKQFVNELEKIIESAKKPYLKK